MKANYKSIISLGVRCNASAVTKHKINKQKKNMVFDDAQMKCPTMIEIINLEKEDVEKYFTDYFSHHFDKEGRQVNTGDWFPHDFNKEFRYDNSTSTYKPTNVEETKKLYIQRAINFIKYLENKEDKVFFTFFSLKHSAVDGVFMDNLIEAVSERVKHGKILFLSFNARNADYSDDRHINHTVATNSWAEAEEESFNWIKSLKLFS